MISDTEAAVGLVGALYQSAAAPERWQHFLQLLARHTNCRSAGVLSHDAGLTNCNLSHSFGLPEEAQNEYKTRYGAINPSIPPLFALARKTGSWSGLLRPLTGEKAYRRSEYYNGFGRRYGSYWGVVATVIRDSGTYITLNAISSEETPAPGPREVQLMATLVPHFVSVAEIHALMASSRAVTGAAVSALNAMDKALIAVDGAAQVILTNPQADEVLRKADAISLSGKRLTAKRPTAARALEALIRAASATGAGRAVHSGGSLLIHRDTGRPLQISVLPFQSNSLLFGAAPCALILLHDPDAHSASRSAILSAIYHLTPAECRLADLLHQDFDVAPAAEVLGITQGTARFMLKNVFRKTRTHRQPELIRFLLGIPSVSSH